MLRIFLLLPDAKSDLTGIDLPHPTVGLSRVREFHVEADGLSMTNTML